MADLDSLLALQDLDIKVEQQLHKRASLPARFDLAEIEARISEKRASRSTLAVTRDEIADRQAAAEAEMKATEARVAQVNARLYSGQISATRELVAMSADVDLLRKRASDFEDQALALMEEREPLDAALAGIDEELAVMEGRRSTISRQLAVGEAVVDAELAALSDQRPVAAGAVPPQLLSTYDRLRGRLGGVAVARLVGGRCDGCHLSLPAMELDRIRHQPPGRLEYCEQCGRILVVTAGI
ncbi:MAG TPA: C4-type zinc ribbon domain-containing protein [Acidimicrobiales bacterium]|nr:C4-type zinc ribbon domain-containing protein [Acidimicrobiales bacterium]